MTDSRPVAVFYGGTNGSGKSSLRELDTDSRIQRHIDPDAIARLIDPSAPRSVDVAAGKEALRQFKQAIADKTSFSMETTLTGTGVLRRMQEAKDAGFEVHLRYVGLASPELNIARVADRVARGGHAISEQDIRRRYAESLDNLLKAIAICDKASIRDNTGIQHVVHLIIEDGQIEQKTKILPRWIQAIESQLLASS